MHVKAGDPACVLGGLTLGVGEVGGDGDDGLGDGLTEIRLGVSLQLLEHHGAYLLGGVCLAVDGHLVVGAHLALYGAYGPVGVGDGLALGNMANHALAVLGEGYHGGGSTHTLGVGDDNRLAALHDRHTAVSSTKIYTDDFTHFDFLLNI